MAQSATILVFDDDPAIRQMIASGLANETQEIIGTGDPAEAREILANRAIDVILADVRLPGTGDLELLDWDEFQNAGADCIVITGFATTEIEIRALQRDAFDIIDKPFSLDRLRVSVSRCLQKRALKRENRDLVESLRRLNQELEQTVADRTSDLRLAYEELVAAKAQVERVEQLKTQFINIVSHEFNTPLNVIKGYLQLFFADVFGKLTAEQNEALRTIETESDRVVELLHEFINIYTLEHESFHFPKDTVPVQPFVQDTVAKLGPFFTQRNQQFILNVPGDLPAINANRRQLSIVIENLLVNAIRFTPDRGLITFSAQPRLRRGQLGVLFVTRDTGVGIPEAEYQRIFDRFYEIGDINRHTSGRLEFGSSGLGLGLAIARKIVEEHGGEIWVESVVGNGSKFYFFIPASAQAKPKRMPTDSTVMMPVPPELREDSTPPKPPTDTNSASASTDAISDR